MFLLLLSVQLTYDVRGSHSILTHRNWRKGCKSRPSGDSLLQIGNYKKNRNEHAHILKKTCTFIASDTFNKINCARGRIFDFCLFGTLWPWYNYLLYGWLQQNDFNLKLISQCCLSWLHINYLSWNIYSWGTHNGWWIEVYFSLAQ